MAFGIAKFRIAKFSHCEFGIARFSHCEIGIGSVNSKLALRNGIWHCEISHCEIKIGIAKSILALRNGIWHCEISVLLIFHAFCPAFNCISFSSLCLGFSFDLWVV